MSGSEHGSRSILAILAVAALLAVILWGCVPYELKQILDGPKGKALGISPSSTVVPALGTVSFSADGGVPPYVFSITSGGGTLDPSTGAYTAPVATGTAVIRVTDKTGRGANASVAIQVLAVPLAISPGALTLAVGSNVTFSPIGGTPPYTFNMQLSGSGTPSVGLGTGLYVAGSNPGTDQVLLTDFMGATSVATVTVTAVSSSVDYTVPATNFVPATGTVSTALPGGYSFTLQNSGSGGGTQTVDWKVYLSANAVLDGGDLLVASGTHAPLAAAGSAPVAVAGTFPAVTPGVWRLIAQVSAADDTTPANNTSGASIVTLSAQDIDYLVPAVSNTGGLVAGAAMSGTFTIHNNGTAAGSATVEWAAYASVDAILDGADYLLGRGSNAALGAGATTGGIPINGFWPSTPGTWYLLATVSATDDIGPANNTTASVGTITTTGPAAANVDNDVVSVTNFAGITAGDPLVGHFTIHNGGTDPGSQPIAWTAYLSSNATLELGTDPVLDSGIHAALGAGATSGTVSFGGTWPSGTGTWWLIVAVSSSDDVGPGNNVTVSGASVSTIAPNIDYFVFSVICTGGTTAGQPLTGTVTLRNAGTHAGSQFVPWAVYLSADATLNIGTDQLLATGALAAPGLGAGATSGAQPFGGTWPQSTSLQTWHFIATVGAGDDVNAGNNVTDSGGIGVTPLDIDYNVPIVTNTGGTTGGGAITANFTVHNNGTVAGSAPVNWTAYLSANAAWDINDPILTTGSTAALGAGATSGPIPFGGTWPAGTATWYLIVRVSAADDISGANDVTSSGAVPVTGVTPVYTITAVPLPAGSTTGQAVTGTFTIQNGPAAGGVSPINWQVYASLGDAIYNAGDVLLQSGSIGGLAASGSSSPGYAGTWPATAGTWYIVVHASAADAPAVADAASGPTAVSNPPQPDYSVTFNAVIPWSGLVSTLMSATGTPQITINNLSANPGNATISWAVYLSADNVLDVGDTLLQSGTNAALAGFGSAIKSFDTTWPAAPGNFYWYIAQVSAADDPNHLDDTIVAPHPAATGNYRYQEGAENNGGTGPSPPVGQTSNMGITTLAANQNIVIEGVMDAFNNDDTYRFTTLGSTNKFSIRAMWATGFDDVDLNLWDTGATDISSPEVGINSEPGNGTLDITGISPAMYFINAYMWLANNTSGSIGQKYVILVRGLP